MHDSLYGKTRHMYYACTVYCTTYCIVNSQLVLLVACTYVRMYIRQEFFPTPPHRAITALQTLVNVHSSKYRDSRGRTVMHILAEQVRKQHTTPAISLTVLCFVCAHICTSVISICSKAQRFNFAVYVCMYLSSLAHLLSMQATHFPSQVFLVDCVHSFIQ